MNALGGGEDSAHSVEQMRHKYEQMKEAGQESLARAFTIAEDGSGKRHWFGIEVSKPVATALDLLLAPVTALVTSQSHKLQPHGEWLANRVGLSRYADKVGLGAVHTATWLTILGPQFISLASIGYEMHTKRKETYQDLAPVLDSRPDGYKNNEVIQTAFAKAHENVSTRLQYLGASLLAAVPNIIFGIDETTKHNAARLDEFKKKKDKTPDVAPLTAYEKAAQERAAKADFAKRLRADDPEIGREEIDYYWEQHRERDHSPPPSTASQGDFAALMQKYMPWVVLAQGGGQVLNAFVDEEKEKRGGRTTAWDMIKALRKEIAEQCSHGNGFGCGSYERRPEDLQLSLPDGSPVSLKQYIVEIFQQNERDHGRAPKDPSQKPIGPQLISRMDDAVGEIADAIGRGMDAIALVNLVGDGKIVRHDGKGGRSFATSAQAQELVAQQSDLFSTTKKVTAEEFYANFADPAMLKDVIGKNLKELKGEERNLFIAIVPEEVLKQVGVSQKEARNAQHSAHKLLVQAVTAYGFELAERAEKDKDPEALKKLGMTEEQIEAVARLGEAVREGNVEAAKRLVEGQDKRVLEAVRHVALNEETKGHVSWQDKVKKGKELMDAAKARASSFAERHAGREGFDMPQGYGEGASLMEGHPHLRERAPRHGAEEMPMADRVLDEKLGKESPGALRS